MIDTLKLELIALYLYEKWFDQKRFNIKNAEEPLVHKKSCPPPPPPEFVWVICLFSRQSDRTMHKKAWSNSIINTSRVGNYTHCTDEVCSFRHVVLASILNKLYNNKILNIYISS